jgi:serine protease
MSKLSKKKSLHKSVIILLIVLFGFPLLSFKDTGEYKIIDGKVISRGYDKFYEVGIINVKFKDQVTVSNFNKFGINNLDNFLSDYNVKQIKQRHPLNANVSKRKIGDEDLAKIFAVKYEKAIDPLDFSQQFINRFSDIIDWAEPSFVYKSDFIPNDPMISSQWHISKINAFQAWDICQGDTSMLIGIVDSGTDFDHPDLAANMHRNWNENPTNSVDDDNNGFVDDWRGWDFWGNDNDPSIMPAGNLHGSHVSGCASQVTNNGVHGAGIGYKVKIMLTKHTDDSNPESLLYNTDAGIIYCYQNGAKVINCSFGSSSYSAYSQSVVNSAWANGTIICASAGNGDASGVGQNWARYPASYDNVISVAATNSSDIKTTFSNYHSTVDVCAPGQGILSTLYNNTYTSYDGTSMSSPITAGTVALIRSKHPGWTAQQVVDRLLIGVDSIYNLNPTYIGLLGTGRVNAFKCLSDYPIVKIVSFIHNDSLYGNNDKVYDVGEVIPVAITFKNTFIAGSNASLRLITIDPDVEIVQDSVYIGNISAYNNFSTSITNTFRVKAKSTCTYDKNVTFTVSNGVNCYTDNNANTFTIKFRQGFATHNVNNLKLAMTNDGAIGKKAQLYGTGLLLYNSNVNQIYESGLMIGVSSTKVSDVSRKGSSPANMSDTDFVPLKSYTMTKPGTISVQDGNGKFNDNGAGTNKIGVEVTTDSYAFTGTNDSNYILIKYNIKNTNTTALSNLYAGIFSFFSPNGNFASDNITRYDAPNKLGYTYYTATPNPYLGIALMTNQNINFKAMSYLDIFDGFTTEEKWQSLSSGIANDSLGPDGTTFTLAAGPLSIPASQSVIVGFAIIKGNNLMDLKNITTIARNKYNSVGVKQISELVPKKYELLQNYPNPFNPVTKIQFAIPKNDNVSIKIYDVLGREVMTLVNEKLNAGYYEFNFNGSALSSGLYFYRMTTNTFTNIKKMVLVK